MDLKKQLKVAQQSKGEESDNKDGQTSQNESSEVNDPTKKLKNEKPTSPSILSPSAQPFIPAAEIKKDKDVKNEGTASTTPEAPKYEKRNFYDDISTDRDMNQRRDMVKKDTETFGDTATNYGYYNRQRPRYFSNGGGGRGRGGRGGWRGGSNSGYGGNNSGYSGNNSGYSGNNSGYSGNNSGYGGRSSLAAQG